MDSNPATTLSIVRYAPNQVDVLHQIVAECGEDLKRRFGLIHWVPPYPIEMMRKNAVEMSVYGVLLDNQIVGTFTIGTHGWKYDERLWANPDHLPLYLGKLAVRPAYQGFGIGGWCLNQVEALACQLNCQTVRFDAIAQHTQLLLFYRKHGYTICGTRPIVDWRGLEWEIVYFEKLLASN